MRKSTPRRVVTLAEWKKRNPSPEEIARLLRAVDEGRPAHELPANGVTTLRRTTARLSNLAGTPKIEGDLAATFEYAVAAMLQSGEREAGLLRATLWRCLHGKRLPPPGSPQKDTHKRVLSSSTYVEAATFANIFCNATERPDVPPEVRELAARAFKELGALVGVPAPAFARTARAWKKTRAAYIEQQRAVRLMCEAEGLKDTPHYSSLHTLNKYTRTGIATSIAVWLGFTVWAYWLEDKDERFAIRPGDLTERLSALHQALERAGEIERYGAEAVKRAVERRAQLEAAAIAAALASVPDPATLLRATTPDIDTALISELGGEWEKFVNELEGGA